MSLAATRRSRGSAPSSPTIEVMPMTTPSTVSAERILLVRSVSTPSAEISRGDRQSDDRHASSLLRRSASDRIEAGRAASPDRGRRTGRRARSCRCRARPTTTRPSAGSGVSCAIDQRDDEARAACRPRRRTIESADRLGQDLARMSRSPRAERLAQADLAGRVSLTTISMMFMMTMPPTTSDRPTTPIEHRERAGGEGAWKMFRSCRR